MRKKLNLTEGIFPMPVLMVAAYNEDGSVNVMNAAWGTMQERGNVALVLSEGHKTVKDIKARGAFTVSIADADHVVEADYFGVVSGNDTPDKFKSSCGVIGKVVNVTADEKVITDGKIDMALVNAIAFDPYTHGYYRVGERVGEAFKDGLKLKK